LTTFFLVLIGIAYLYLIICIVWFTQISNFNKALMISVGVVGVSV